MKKRFEFSYDLSDLQTWSLENANDMFIKSILGEVLPRYSTIRANIRGTEQIGVMTNEIHFQDGDLCGFNPSGSTTISQVTIETCSKRLNQSLCPYTLYDYYLTQRLSSSNFQEEVPFAELLTQDISNRAANQIEKQLWRNTKATGATEYNSACFDGVKALVTSGNGATVIAYTAATSTNALQVFSQLYVNLPTSVVHLNDITIFCSYADYRALVQDMVNKSFINLFDFNSKRAAEGDVWTLMLPATNVRVVPTEGLDGQNTMIIGPSSYFQVGFNATENGGIELKQVYDPYEDVVKVMARMVYGLGIFSIDSFAIAR
jgi:hypothetical protein